MTAVLEGGTHKMRTLAGTPCSRRGCYAQVDGYPHSYYEQTGEPHGIRVAESSTPAKRRGLPNAWPDNWSVQLRADGDEPWRVAVVVHAKAWPKKKAPYCAFADYTVPDAPELVVAIAKAERMRKRLARLAESEGSR